MSFKVLKVVNRNKTVPMVKVKKIEDSEVKSELKRGISRNTLLSRLISPIQKHNFNGMCLKGGYQYHVI